MTRRRLDAPSRVFLSVSLGHLIVDIFAGVSTVVMVFASAHVLHLNNTQLGIALSGFAICGAISQPLFGWLGDHTGGRWIGSIGVVWLGTLLVVSMAVAQATHNYVLTLIPFALAALGSAAFHPIGTMHASEVNHARTATNTSVFFMSGYIGGGIGPLLAGFLLDHSLSHTTAFAHLLGPALGPQLLDPGNPLPATAIIALLSLPVPIFMALSLPSREAHVERRANDRATGLARRVSLRRWTPVLVVVFVAIVALRGMVNPGSVTFMPQLFQSKGWDSTQYGLIASLAALGAGFAGLGLGMLAERYDARYLLALALILSAPLLFIVHSLGLIPGFIAALLIGALSGGPQSLVVLMAQDVMPGRKGLASGGIMGFMFTFGAIGTLLVGRVADAAGMATTYRLVAVVALVAGLLALVLPSEQRAPKPVPTSVEPSPAALEV